MFWNELATNAPVYFLIFARVFALMSVTPLLSSSAIPGVLRVSFAMLVTFIVYPMNPYENIPLVLLEYILLLAGEALLGILYGFAIQLVYAAFQTAGQFFSMQMGFSASVIYDPLSQEELPILGQFFNLGSMFLFLTTDGMQRIFLGGVRYSFRTISAIEIAAARDHWLTFFVSSVGQLFQQALILAIPIMGTLFLVSLSMGLLAKAAPQMNLLMLGFPINISVALLMIFVVLPFLLETFGAFIDNAFVQISQLMQPAGGTP